MNGKLNFELETPFLDCNITRMITVFIDDFNRWILYILTNRIYLIVLWIIKIFFMLENKYSTLLYLPDRF